jgi:hypothetical protein
MRIFVTYLDQDIKCAQIVKAQVIAVLIVSVVKVIVLEFVQIMGLV